MLSDKFQCLPKTVTISPPPDVTPIGPLKAMQVTPEKVLTCVAAVTCAQPTKASVTRSSESLGGASSAGCSARPHPRWASKWTFWTPCRRPPPAELHTDTRYGFGILSLRLGLGVLYESERHYRLDAAFRLFLMMVQHVTSLRGHLSSLLWGQIEDIHHTLSPSLPQAESNALPLFAHVFSGTARALR